MRIFLREERELGRSAGRLRIGEVRNARIPYKYQQRTALASRSILCTTILTVRIAPVEIH